ncbi:unnamed protein product [Peniophora sp. CBMAI 1063]|nr:unnamed protein product [Peniophora sp. CBMAI 1063]
MFSTPEYSVSPTPIHQLGWNRARSAYSSAYAARQVTGAGEWSPSQPGLLPYTVTRSSPPDGHSPSLPTYLSVHPSARENTPSTLDSSSAFASVALRSPPESMAQLGQLMSTHTYSETAIHQSYLPKNQGYGTSTPAPLEALHPPALDNQVQPPPSLEQTPSSSPSGWPQDMMPDPSPQNNGVYLAKGENVMMNEWSCASTSKRGSLDGAQEGAGGFDTAVAEGTAYTESSMNSRDGEYEKGLGRAVPPWRVAEYMRLA